ncbi:hypothetical protein F0562_018989 [Nyssa sinensis]|uniref:Uncharacterized protein n=1 Tax=Nyssa sinensis TaxID=561372 RepID=A0A5J4ZAD5_9ASTE|nr:hypothetical protein F0562_018989 [Nyssa sinensis]
MSKPHTNSQLFPCRLIFTRNYPIMHQRSMSLKEELSCFPVGFLASSMASSSSSSSTSSSLEQRKEEIFKELRDDKTVVLVGEHGIGKTWMARETSDRALKEHLFTKTLWVFLNRKYNSRSLHESIASQLSLVSATVEWEVEDDNGEAEKKYLEDLKQKISSTLARHKCLLVLDGEGNKMTDAERSELKTLLVSSCCLLITTTNSSSNIVTDQSTVIEVKRLSDEESSSLLRREAGTQVFEYPGIEFLADAVAKKSKGLPAAIVATAKALSYFGQNKSKGGMESALQEAADNGSYDATQLLCSFYNMLPEKDLIDCCWHSNYIFRDHGSIHYNELIAYWMMEGYLGEVNCIEKAYERGHCVLMELLDLGILKKQRVHDVIMEGAMLNLADGRRCGFFEMASLGMAEVFKDGECEGLGSITLADGMIKTLCTGKRRSAISTLLLDGNRLFKEIPRDFDQSNMELQVLVIFNPALIKLPLSLAKMKSLNVLVLRGCDFLENIDDIGQLNTLKVLEVSGSSSLEMIPDNLFKHMPHLQSLNLSTLQIKSLPSSVYDLSELCWLILRRCHCLTTQISLKSLKNLLVLDLSGATSFTDFKEGTFEHNKKLQVLNLSKTKIKKLPKFLALGELTHLLLSGCECLIGLPSIQYLVSLQILDLSGAINFREFHRQTFENNVSLKILDLSKTKIKRLTAKISNPHYLQVLDLSCASELVEIENQFFEHLIDLRQLLLSRCSSLVNLPDLNSHTKLEVLDLSETKIKDPPSLSNLSNLRRLLLKKCTDLKELPLLKSLSKLEELYLSGISSLRGTGADFLEHMSQLRILDLSETLLKELPPLSNLKNLNHLSLADCPHLVTVPHLEALTELEFLDLSGTAINHPPNMKNIQGACSRKIKYQWSISRWPAEALTESDRHPISESGTQFLQLLEESPSLWDTNLKKFHFFIHPLGTQNNNGDKIFYRHDNNGDKIFYRNELIFRDIYFCTRKFAHPFERSLEIHGFCSFPNGVELVLRHAEFVFLIDNSFIRKLSDLDGKNTKEMKVCWIERCNKMESVFHVEKVDNCAKLGEKTVDVTKLEEISEDVAKSGDIARLEEKFLHVENLQGKSFENLKYLYLDCCPKLSSVFSPQRPENLEILQIKFCDNLDTLLESESAECTLPKLHTLHLLALPKLKSIGCKLPSLRSLKVVECAMLVNVLSSPQLPENLEILQIKFCEKLEIVFEDSVSAHYSLPNLRTLHLQELPNLRSVGGEFPPELDGIVRECPKLQTRPLVGQVLLQVSAQFLKR